MVELYERLGSVRAVATHLECSRGSVYKHLNKIGVLGKPLTGGTERATKALHKTVPKRGVKRYLITSAQNNTLMHEANWSNLLALKKYYNAELLVGTYTYNKNAFGKLSVKAGTKAKPETELWYDERLLPYIEDHNVDLAPGLRWCGRMNTLPTATNPLSGFETYTGRKSGIFPHAKHAMQSVPSGKFEDTKFNYTTGTTTLQNYVQKTAGIKAEHHHTYGALLVEVTAGGNWYVRQLQTDKHGLMQDLQVSADDGRIRKRSEIASITWGDVHGESIDPTIRELAWGKGGILDELKPSYQFCHDLIDFGPRNHHNRGDPHFRFKRHVQGKDTVQAEMEFAAELLHQMQRKKTKTVVVNSNHDNALARWLREADYRTDPANAMFFLECQLECYKAIEDGDQDFMIFEHVLVSLGIPEYVRFLREDESCIIAGIEQGNHGHLGPNGSYGSPRALAKQGRKQNTDHTHTCGILDGVYTGGTMSLLDLLYNKGPSSWSHSFIVTYRNGKRTIVTIYNGRYRA